MDAWIGIVVHNDDNNDDNDGDGDSDMHDGVRTFMCSLV